MRNEQDLLYSFYTIRKTIGILGIILPIVIYLGYGELVSSISHYYYTRSAVFFIAILTAFGLFLLSYRGYKRDKTKEWISDNAITHIAGLSILMVVLIPTACTGSGSPTIEVMAETKLYPMFGHNSKWFHIIHIISAATFFFSMGYMSMFRFTKGIKTLEKKRKNRIFIICGATMWASIAIIFIEMLMEKTFLYHTFIIETIAIVAFGFSWIVKGEAIKKLLESDKNKS